MDREAANSRSQCWTDAKAPVARPFGPTCYNRHLFLLYRDIAGTRHPQNLPSVSCGRVSCHLGADCLATQLPVLCAKCANARMRSSTGSAAHCNPGLALAPMSAPPHSPLSCLG